MVGELNCNSCKKRVAVNTMRYSKDGAGLVCAECSEKQSGKLKVPSPNAAKELPIRKVPLSNQKIEYRCKSCGHMFTRAADYFLGQKVCPMCGRDSVVFELPSDADDLLRKLEDLD